MFNLFKKNDLTPINTLNSLVLNFLQEKYSIHNIITKKESCLSDYYVNNIKKHAYFANIIFKNTIQLPFQQLNAQIICEKEVIYFSIEVITNNNWYINYFCDFPIELYKPLYINLVNHFLNDNKIYNDIDEYYLFLFKNTFKIDNDIPYSIITKKEYLLDIAQDFILIDSHLAFYKIKTFNINDDLSTNKDKYINIKYTDAQQITSLELEEILKYFNFKYNNSMLNDINKFFTSLKKQSKKYDPFPLIL